ncbi:MAG: OmpH family outer membrane protein [Chlamydiia bacterium]|nr:OmpH family outer membrane protein [Chlamydiia bacterium]
MRNRFLSVALFSLVAASAVASESTTGFVNFSSCVTDSKYGKKEQENMENLRKQMSSLIENTEKELREISAKFEDTEYLDTLSPKAEEDLKVKHQALQEDLARYQQQFYQVLNHANYQMVQKMSNVIAAASEKIAEKSDFSCIVNREACFYIKPNLDVTGSVISQMDQSFDEEAKMKKISDNSGEAEQMQSLDELTVDQAR